jgi:hypothetical protein
MTHPSQYVGDVLAFPMFIWLVFIVLRLWGEREEARVVGNTGIQGYRTEELAVRYQVMDDIIVRRSRWRNVRISQF